MNEHTATALAYGIYRSNDFDPEKPMTVALLGHCMAWDHGRDRGSVRSPKRHIPNEFPVGWRCTTPLISEMDRIVPNLSLSITITMFLDISGINWTSRFCSMGHSIFSVSIVQFVRGKLHVLSETSDRVGGRDMDECLMREFAAQFQKKAKIAVGVETHGSIIMGCLHIFAPTTI
jgi:hypothetical protein